MRPEDFTSRLRNAAWLKRPETQALFAALDGETGRTRAVGGIVRDTLVGHPREGGDIDFATEFEPQEVTTLALAAGASVYPTGIEHGTVTVKFGSLAAEVTTLREDVATDGRRANVIFGTDWRRDAERRDFTLNALFAGMTGELFDPLGGLGDCIAGRVRFIGDPGTRIAEDRLRVYRFFRFSASHGGEKFDPAGLEACTAWAPKLEAVSAERVGAEIRRMLELPRVAATFREMSGLGLVPFDGDTVARLQAYERRAAGPEAAARLALIVDSVGDKPLKASWRLSNDEVALAKTILAAARLIADFKLHEAAYRYPAALAEAVDVAAVLAGWTDAGRSAVLEELRSLKVPQFPMNGDALLAAGFKPGPQLGSELDRLEQLWIRSGFTLGRDELLAEARRRD